VERLKIEDWVCASIFKKTHFHFEGVWYFSDYLKKQRQAYEMPYDIYTLTGIAFIGY
jgi:hypothetical protein